MLDYRDFPAVAPKIAPQGSHDACFLPRNRHFTGDIRIHEIAFARGELWVVATSFSCLATLDAQHSFVPRWTPPFITELVPEDRCHLNGLCVVEDTVRYVTALGESDDAGRLAREQELRRRTDRRRFGRDGAGGLSMPHSPRWHDGRLWLLESGNGTLSLADLDAGSLETVAELPGFTRGLVFASGRRVRRPLPGPRDATFGGLPLRSALDERLCGIWAVEPEAGKRSACCASRSWSRRSSTSPCSPACAGPRSPRKARTRPASPSCSPTSLRPAAISLSRGDWI